MKNAKYFIFNDYHAKEKTKMAKSGVSVTFDRKHRAEVTGFGKVEILIRLTDKVKKCK